MFSFGRLGFKGGRTSMDWHSNHTFGLVISLKNGLLPKIKKNYSALTEVFFHDI